MNKEKQIKSSDWLIKGYSNEQLAEMKAKAIEEAEQELREKQIKEMANDYYEAMLKARGTLGKKPCNSNKTCGFCDRHNPFTHLCRNEVTRPPQSYMFVEELGV